MDELYADDLRLGVVRLIEERHSRPEAADLCGISLSSVGRLLGLTFKEVLHATEQDHPDVAAMRQRGQRDQRQLNPKRPVFIDETAISTGMTRRGGGCPQGERLVCKVPFGSWQTATMVTALRHDRLTAPMLLKVPRTGESFRTDISRVLAPTLKRGDIVVLDNVPLHRTRGVREALERLGVTAPEFRAYSPDPNPIEQPIGKLKTFLRKVESRSWRSLLASVRKGLKRFSPAECAAYLRHAEYGQPKRKMVYAPERQDQGSLPTTQGPTCSLDSSGLCRRNRMELGSLVH